MVKKKAGRGQARNKTARGASLPHALLQRTGGNALQSARKPFPPAPFRLATAEENGQGSSFPIVGIGASAGGLEAFTELLSHLPDDTGMAFVLIQHLDPKHESHLTELLSKVSKMPVSEVKAIRAPRPITFT